MQAPRLVATDVDGTLLNPFDEVTPRTSAVIERLVAGGVTFVLVTGRPPRWIPPVVAQLPMTRFAVCANGGVLYDAVEDRVVWSRTIDPATLAELATVITATLPGCRLAVEGVGEVAAGDHFVAEPDYIHAWADGDNHTVPRTDLLTRPAVKMLIRDPEMRSDAMVAALAPVIGDAADLTFSHPRGLVEISPAGVTKATGLATVAARYGANGHPQSAVQASRESLIAALRAQGMLEDSSGLPPYPGTDDLPPQGSPEEAQLLKEIGDELSDALEQSGLSILDLIERR